jgi:hypothetical protein
MLMREYNSPAVLFKMMLDIMKLDKNWNMVVSEAISRLRPESDDTFRKINNFVERWKDSNI